MDGSFSLDLLGALDFVTLREPLAQARSEPWMILHEVYREASAYYRHIDKDHLLCRMGARHSMI